MSNSESKKNKGGRPSKIDQSFDVIYLVEKLASKGLTNEEMASVLDMSISTFYEHQAKNEKFSDAIKRGKENPDRNVENALYNRAIGITVKEQRAVSVRDSEGGSCVEIVDLEKELPPDTISCIFWLKNRRPDLWKDKQIVEQTNTDTTYCELSVEELEKLILSNK